VHADEETSEAGAKQVELPAVTIRGSVAGKSYEWLGVLARTDAFVDANSRMYYAVIEVLNPFAAQDSKSMQQAPLLPGLFVEAEIDGKELHNVLVLPRAALIQRDKIITLDDDGVVKYQTVNVLRKSATEVWVQGEIAENTLVSIEKQSLTPPGSIVEPVLNAGSGTSVAVKADTVAVKD
jgi:multidrug efflux pump subunit AcrA (membrane-fusion protein)